MNPDQLTPEQAREFAEHKAKSAAVAIQWARELELENAIEKAVASTQASLREELRAIFGDGDQTNPTQMKVLVQRIPVLCRDIGKMHDDISQTREAVAGINDNLKWGVRLVLGAVFLALMGLVLIP